MRRRFFLYWIVFLFIGLAVVALLFFQQKQRPVLSNESSDVSLQQPRAATFDSMLKNGENALYVENQLAGSSSVWVGFVVLSHPGFVRIFDDLGGVPGQAIGQSDLLLSGGEHILIPLSKPLQEGQVYYAILYQDDGDGRLREDKDVQVVDKEQTVILMNFVALKGVQPESEAITP